MTNTTPILLRTHRDNFNRFIEVLSTDLTPYERRYVEQRMIEERSAIRSLIVAFGPRLDPDVLSVQHAPLQ